MTSLQLAEKFNVSDTSVQKLIGCFKLISKYSLLLKTILSQRDIKNNVSKIESLLQIRFQFKKGCDIYVPNYVVISISSFPFHMIIKINNKNAK